MGSEPFLGEIMLFAGRQIPHGWMVCDGRTLSIQQNVALYSLLGTKYGGDGKTTFALPDLRGRVPMYISNGQDIGTRGGMAMVKIKPENLPPHTHNANVPDATVKLSSPMMAYSKGGNTTSPQDAVPAVINLSGENQMGYSKQQPNVTMKEVFSNVKLQNVKVTMSSNGDVAIENRQPSLAINYLIAVQGYYPPRP